MTNPYPGPMQPAPQLAPHGRPISLRQPRAIVHVFEAGPKDRPAVVLIHGLQDEADTWRHVFEPLAQSHHVIALDLPGFGRSDKAKRAYSMPFYVDVVMAVMDALGIHYATLIGNSMGAIIAETIALRHPARVLRLVLVDGTLRIVEQPQSTSTNVFRMLMAPALDRRYFEALRRSPQAAFDTLEPFYANLMGMPHRERDFLFQRVNERVWDEPQRLAALAIQMSLPRFFVTQVPSLTRRIPSFAIPTQVIWGAHDGIVPIGNGRARAASQSGAQFTVIDDAGHLPHQEQPEAFLGVLHMP